MISCSNAAAGGEGGGGDSVNPAPPGDQSLAQQREEVEAKLAAPSDFFGAAGIDGTVRRPELERTATGRLLGLGFPSAVRRERGQVRVGNEVGVGGGPLVHPRAARHGRQGGMARERHYRHSEEEGEERGWQEGRSEERRVGKECLL